MATTARLVPMESDALASFRSPLAVRYIKLGRGGVWAPQAFTDGIIPFGFREIAHAPCAVGAAPQPSWPKP